MLWILLRSVSRRWFMLWLLIRSCWFEVVSMLCDLLPLPYPHPLPRIKALTLTLLWSWAHASFAGSHFSQLSHVRVPVIDIMICHLSGYQPVITEILLKRPCSHPTQTLPSLSFCIIFILFSLVSEMDSFSFWIWTSTVANRGFSQKSKTEWQTV